MADLCNDCKNSNCPMQSGIKRNECAFYISPNKGGYVSLELVLDLTEYMCRDCHLDCKECMLAEPLSLLKKMKTADVRPVVLCRDCKHFNPYPGDCTDGGIEGVCKRHNSIGVLVMDEDFCSAAERT